MLFLALYLHTSRLTLHCLVVEVVVLLLFPPMTASASVFEFATISVSLGLIFGMPESALDAPVVFIDMWFATEILPVVSVDAFIPLMTLILVIERTPDCLEMEKVEVCVLLHLVKHIDAKLFFAVCKRA